MGRPRDGGLEMIFESWEARGLRWGRASGRLTRKAQTSVLSTQGRALETQSLPGQVLLCQMAQPAMSAQAMAENLVAVAREHQALALPAALVVSADQLPHWCAYARAAGDRGFLRGVFSGADGPELAAAWAVRMAHVMQVMRPVWRATPISSTSPRKTPVRAGILVGR